MGMPITGVRYAPKICLGVAQQPSGPKIPLLTIQPNSSGKPRTDEAISKIAVPEFCPLAFLPKATMIGIEIVHATTTTAA